VRIETAEWIEPGGGKEPVLRLLDQTQLPAEVVYVDCTDAEMVAESIEVLRVRGAPAIASPRPTGLPWRPAMPSEKRISRGVSKGP
jgi:methylthioribose-1-phosphate isomerase